MIVIPLHDATASPYFFYLQTMEWKEYIVADPDVLLGKPTIKGTRISVEHIVGLFAQGWSESQILESYPRLTKSALQAVFAYVQDCMSAGLFFPPFKQTA